MRVIRRQCLWSTTLLHVGDKSCIVTNPKAMNHCEVLFAFLCENKGHVGSNARCLAAGSSFARLCINPCHHIQPTCDLPQSLAAATALSSQNCSLSSFIVTPTTSSTGPGIIRLRLPGIFVSLATCKAVADHRPTSLAPNRFPRRRSYSCGVVESLVCIRYLGTL